MYLFIYLFIYSFIYLIFIYLFIYLIAAENHITNQSELEKIRTCHNQVINCSESSTRRKSCTMPETGQHGLCRILKHEATYIST